MYQPIIYYHFSTCPFIYPSIYQFTHHPSIIYLSVYLPIIYLSLISHLFLEPTQLGPYPSLPCTLYFHFMYHRPLCFSEHTSTLKKKTKQELDMPSSGCTTSSLTSSQLLDPELLSSMWLQVILRWKPSCMDLGTLLKQAG